MNSKTSDEADIASLVGELSDRDGVVRERARKALVTLGGDAVSPLNDLLISSHSEQARWEAAKILGKIEDKRSIPALVKALGDSNTDVGWVAAEGLKKFEMDAWPSLLNALIEGDPEDSGLLYLGAHHVLVDQKEDGYDDLLATLLKDLEEGGLSESAMVAARKMLARMKPGQ